MTESQRIADQLKRAFDGEAWHGPALREALDGVTAAMAVAHPIAGAHSIWEITAHLAGWEDVVSRRLTGEVLTEPPEGDFPAAPADAGEDAWAALQAKAHAGHARLVQQIGELTEAGLKARLDEKPYPVWFMAHGAVSHALYHVGQIVLLKKSLS